MIYNILITSEFHRFNITHFNSNDINIPSEMSWDIKFNQWLKTNGDSSITGLSIESGHPWRSYEERGKVSTIIPHITWKLNLTALETYWSKEWYGNIRRVTNAPHWYNVRTTSTAEVILRENNGIITIVCHTIRHPTIQNKRMKWSIINFIIIL